MLKNSVCYRSLIPFFVFLFVLTCLNVESQAATLEEFNTSMTVLNSVANEITNKKTTLGQYFTIRTGIVNMLAENNEDLRDNALNSTDLGGAISALGLNLLDEMDGVTLKNHLDGVNTSIETFIRTEIDVGIFQRKGNDSGVVVGYNQAYDNYKADYNGLSRSDRKK